MPTTKPANMSWSDWNSAAVSARNEANGVTPYFPPSVKSTTSYSNTAPTNTAPTNTAPTNTVSPTHSRSTDGIKPAKIVTPQQQQTQQQKQQVLDLFSNYFPETNLDTQEGQAGVNYWVNDLNNGQSIADVENSFKTIANQQTPTLNSDWAQQNFGGTGSVKTGDSYSSFDSASPYIGNTTQQQSVKNLFDTYFPETNLTAPDRRKGFNYWVKELQSGKSLADVEKSFQDIAKTKDQVFTSPLGGVSLDGSVVSSMPSGAVQASDGVWEWKGDTNIDYGVVSPDGKTIDVATGKDGTWQNLRLAKEPLVSSSGGGSGGNSISNAYNAPPPSKDLVSVYEEVNKNTRGNNLQNKQRLAERFDYYSNMYYNDPNTFKLMLNRAKDTDQELYQQLLKVQESNKLLANKNEALANTQFQQRIAKLRTLEPQLQSRFLELIKANNPALHSIIAGAL